MRPPVSVLLWCVAAVLGGVYATPAAGVSQPTLGYRSVPLLHVDGLQFKDLNRNGKLDPYEDWRLSPGARAADLVRQMSIEDMAGVMVHGTLPAIGGADASIGRGSGYDIAKLKNLIESKRINTFSSPPVTDTVTH
jgi:beta-glucosidase